MSASEPRRIRDLYIYDNLPVLRGLDTDSVDLIYLDPPFNSKQQHRAPIGSKAEGQKFDDTWRWDELNTAWLGEIDTRNEALSAVVRAAGLTLGQGTAAYLTMVGIRLLEMERILKPAGSIYLHCDDTAGAYLKACMDAVFKRGYKNEITWRRFTAHSDGKRYGRITEYILFYVNGTGYTWNAEEVADKKTYEEILQKYPKKDKRGRYYGGDLTGPGVSGGESGKAWKGINPSLYGRCWSAPLTGKYAEWIDANIIPGYRKIKGVHDRLDILYENGLIELPKGTGRWPSLKRYASSDVGLMPQSLILEPIGFTNYNKKGKKGAKQEYTGWKTQKPLGLLRPLIKASSNRGDVVLDPFCGCATACVAAELEGRQWIGIDRFEDAGDITKLRLSDMVLDWQDDQIRVLHKPPKAVEPDEPGKKGRTKKYKTSDNTDKLYGNQHGDCPGCGNHYRVKGFHIDHIIPVASGGKDDIENLQLLCGHCNSTKGTGTMDDLWQSLIDKEVIIRDEANKLRNRWKKRNQKIISAQATLTTTGGN